MSHLEHCTLTDESPQGKQKVYLCFHPDDFDLYFKTIRADIFTANPGCAIYYDCDTESPYNRDDLLLSLSNCRYCFCYISDHLDYTRAGGRQNGEKSP